MRKVILVGAVLLVGGCDWVDELNNYLKTGHSQSAFATCYNSHGAVIYPNKEMVVSYQKTDNGYVFKTKTAKYETNGTCIFESYFD